MVANVGYDPSLTPYEGVVLPSHSISIIYQIYKRYTSVYATQPINTHVKRYQNLTPQGLNFYLSLSDTGVCYIIVYDVFTAEAQMRYFTNVSRALRFINNL
jgi:hypothetical protein